VITRQDLARAAWDNDAVADESPGQGIPNVAHKVNTTAGAVVYVAQQRALRMVISSRGPEEAKRISDQAYANEISIEDLSEEEVERAVAYQAVWIDACFTGMRAMQSDAMKGGFYPS